MQMDTLTNCSGSRASTFDTGILLEAGTNELELLVFEVTGQLFAVNVAKVREARTLEHATFLPLFPDSVEGMVRVRDTVVPAVDLHKYLWGSVQAGTRTGEKLLLLEFNNQLIAFRVAAVDRVHRVSWKEILPLPPGTGQDVPVTGLVLLDGKIVVLLDFESIGVKLGISGSLQVSEHLATASIPAEIPCRLVFADDSALIRRMMHDTLERAGYQDVHIFADGQEAWDYVAELARHHTPESIRESVAAIITDIEMPRMDGLSLTKQVRQHPVLKDVPVILFSSLVSRDNEKKGRQVGATAQISKPKWEDLSSTLVEVLDQVVQHGS